MKINKLELRLIKKYFTYDDDSGKLLWKEMPPNSKNRLGEEVGYPSSDGYLLVKINKKAYFVHHIIWKYHNGNIPDDRLIDHFDGVKINNRISNLRLVTHTESNRSLSMPKTNTSGHIGVSFNKKTGKWRAAITVNNKNISLGSHTSIESAIRARKKAEREYGFSPTHGRTTTDTEERLNFSKAKTGEDKLIPFD